MELTTKEDYNNIPVYYCKHCLSLRIKGVDNLEYCEECGSTDIDEMSIDEWTETYKNKNGVEYLNNKI